MSLASLIHNESGGNYAAQNAVNGGHFGRLQFGQARLAEAAKALGQTITPQQFMADPALQHRVEGWHWQDIDDYIAKRGLDKFIGRKVGGIPVTKQGMRSGAHIGGKAGMAKFLLTGGKYNPADAYGTRISDYLARHNGAGKRSGNSMSTTINPINPYNRKTDDLQIWMAANDISPVERSAMDRVRTGLIGAGEAMTALGMGRAPTFEATDRWMAMQKDERLRKGLAKQIKSRGFNATTGGVNLSIQQLEKMGRTDLAESVRNGGLSAEDALKEAYKHKALPGRRLDKQQSATANQLRDEYRKDSAPLRVIHTTAKNILNMLADPSRATDSVAIQQFAKLIDPMSVVREGEVTIQMSNFGGVEGVLNNFTSQIDPSTQRLSDEAHKDLRRLTHIIVRSAAEQAKREYDEYVALAAQQGIPGDFIGPDPNKLYSVDSVAPTPSPVTPDGSVTSTETPAGQDDDLDAQFDALQGAP